MDRLKIFWHSIIQYQVKINGKLTRKIINSNVSTSFLTNLVLTNIGLTFFPYYILNLTK